MSIAYYERTGKRIMIYQLEWKKGDYYGYATGYTFRQAIRKAWELFQQYGFYQLKIRKG